MTIFACSNYHLLMPKICCFYHKMQLCMPKSLYTSKETEVLVKYTLIRSAKATVSVIAVGNKMQSEPVKSFIGRQQEKKAQIDRG